MCLASLLAQDALSLVAARVCVSNAALCLASVSTGGFGCYTCIGALLAYAGSVFAANSQCEGLLAQDHN